MRAAPRPRAKLISAGPGHSVAALTVRVSVGHSKARDGLVSDPSQPPLTELQNLARSLFKIKWKAPPGGTQ